MLMRTDPFRELDRLSQQVFGNFSAGTWSRPASIPMDAYRQGDQFVVHFDIPGVEPSSIDVDVERNVLTVKAERRPSDIGENVEMLVHERPLGVYSRQLFLGDTLDAEHAEATYDCGCSPSPSRCASRRSRARSAWVAATRRRPSAASTAASGSLWCADSDWVAERFAAIIAENWPAEPGATPGPDRRDTTMRTIVRVLPDRGAGPGPVNTSPSRPSRTPVRRCEHRQRSPPPLAESHRCAGQRKRGGPIDGDRLTRSARRIRGDRSSGTGHTARTHRH